MKTQYYTASSLDGFIATDDHSLDWLLQFGSTVDTSYPQFIAEVGALAMGSSTYEWMLQHLDDSGWPYPQPTWVFTTRTLPELPGANIQFVSGDIRPVHEAMKGAAGDKNIWLVGGGELVGKFYDAGLLDELIVQITPVTLGSGKPVLPRKIAFPPMARTSVQTYGDSFVEIRYAVSAP